MSLIRGNYAATVAKGRLSQAAMDASMALITPTLNFDDIADSDIVIEAVFENMDLKKDIFTRLDALCRPDAVLATNTSSLDVNEIAAVTKRPQQVVGLHFFSPANVMKLLEIVRGEKTSPEVLATALALSKKLGKVGVVVGVCDSFAANRSLYAYTRQAGFLIEEGALPEQVDKVIVDFGFPMGPFAMGDLAGVDVGYKVRQGRPRPPGRYSDIADKLYEMGRYGQKTSAGWFKYEKGSQRPCPIRWSRTSSSRPRRSGASSAVRSPTRRSSNGACSRSSTRALAFSKRASWSVPVTWTSSGSTDTDSPAIAAVPCSGPTSSASTTCTPS
jgi:3-hydroxyacyl-CoA dehydrogenase